MVLLRKGRSRRGGTRGCFSDPPQGLRAYEMQYGGAFFFLSFFVMQVHTPLSSFCILRGSVFFSLGAWRNVQDASPR